MSEGWKSPPRPSVSCHCQSANTTARRMVDKAEHVFYPAAFFLNELRKQNSFLGCGAPFANVERCIRSTIIAERASELGIEM